MAEFQPAVFRLDEERYGINISYVNAIERMQSIVRVPNSDDNIKGIINLRGDIIPVVNLRAKFRTPNQIAPENSEFMIIELEQAKIALEVDNVEGIQNVEEGDMVDMPIIAKGENVDYYDGVAKIGENLVIIINPMKLLSENEMEAVERLADDKSGLAGR